MKNLIVFCFLLCSLAAFSQTYYFDNAEIYDHNTDEFISPVTAAVSCKYSPEDRGYQFYIAAFDDYADPDDIDARTPFFFVAYPKVRPDFDFIKGSTTGENGIGMKDIYIITLNGPVDNKVFIATCYKNGQPSSIYISQQRDYGEVDHVLSIPYTYKNKKQVYELVELAKRKLGSN